MPRTYQIILHEVAHAIEALDNRKASENQQAISKALNESAKQHKEAGQKHRQLYADYEKAKMRATI